jgi:hypothetical protein
VIGMSKHIGFTPTVRHWVLLVVVVIEAVLVIVGWAAYQAVQRRFDDLERPVSWSASNSETNNLRSELDQQRSLLYQVTKRVERIEEALSGRQRPRGFLDR